MRAPSIVPAPAPDPTRPLTAGSAAGMTEKAIIADAANATICTPRTIAHRPRALQNMPKPQVREGMAIKKDMIEDLREFL